MMDVEAAANFPTITPGVTESYRHGWQQLWKNFFELFLGLIIMLAIIIPISIVIVIILAIFVPDYWIQQLINYGLGFFIYGPIGFGWAYMTLRAVRNEKVEIQHLFQPFRRYGQAVLAYFLMYLIISIPFIISTVVLILIYSLGVFLTILAVIFTIFLYCKLAFMPYILVDKEVNAIQAIKASWNMTNGYAGKVFLIGLLGIPIAIAGVICFIVGVIPATMWIYMAIASLYHAVDMRNRGVANTTHTPLPGGSDSYSGERDRDIYHPNVQRQY